MQTLWVGKTRSIAINKYESEHALLTWSNRLIFRASYPVHVYPNNTGHFAVKFSNIYTRASWVRATDIRRLFLVQNAIKWCGPVLTYRMKRLWKKEEESPPLYYLIPLLLPLLALISLSPPPFFQSFSFFLPFLAIFPRRQQSENQFSTRHQKKNTCLITHH